MVAVGAQDESQPVEVMTGTYRYSYNIKEVLGDTDDVVTVEIDCEGMGTDSEATWRRKEPSKNLAASVDGIEDGLRAWAIGPQGITNCYAVSQIRPIQLDVYPRQLICKGAILTAGKVSLVDYFIHQIEGQTPTYYEVI